MPDSQEIIAIVVAGGVGSRFGGPIPKQLMNLGGHPVLHHALRKFEAADSVGRIVVAANVDWSEEIGEICDSALRRTPFEMVAAGAERNISIRNALVPLKEVEQARILVHDGVRPLVTTELIARVAASLSQHRSVIPVIPSSDPLVVVSGDRVRGFEQRDTVMRGQSPQGFQLSDLRLCLEGQVDAGMFSTVFEALRAMDPGAEIVCVEGDPNNLKVTTPIDRVIAGRLLLEE